MCVLFFSLSISSGFVYVRAQIFHSSSFVLGFLILLFTSAGIGNYFCRTSIPDLVVVMF